MEIYYEVSNVIYLNEWIIFIKGKKLKFILEKIYKNILEFLI